MSAHEHVDESGTNRVWLSMGVIIGGIILGVCATQAAPRSPNSRHTGPSGLVVLADGTVKRGTVLVRGKTVVLIREQGDGHEELLIPRTHVRWFQTHGTELGEDYFQSFRDAPLKDSRPRKEEPRPHTAPPQEPKGAAKPAPNPPSDDRLEAVKRRKMDRRANRTILWAELAQTEGDWGKAAPLWAEVYEAEGFRKEYLANLRTCCEKWIDNTTRYEQRLKIKQELELAFEGVLQRAEIRDIYATVLTRAFKMSSLKPQNAIYFAEALGELGGRYEAESRQLIESMRR